MAFDLYQHVTDTIIASLEAGTPAWRKPWTGDTGAAAFPRRANGEPYRGINVLMLWLSAAEKGYRAAHWFTYRQAQEAGGQVRKGEKSATVVKYGTVEREDEGAEEARKVPYLKAYRVFNAEQIDGLPAEFTAPPAEEPRDLGTAADPELDAFFAAAGADIGEYRGNGDFHWVRSSYEDGPSWLAEVAGGTTRTYTLHGADSDPRVIGRPGRPEQTVTKNDYQGRLRGVFLRYRDHTGAIQSEFVRY
ncbi:protein of unknown function [Paracoccus solventivorans]|uniref:N-terminal domain-containing protein n=1 Tax=Paracoccus solventivorans TaxID=53463 RepID=A0A1M7JW32_9RHOB|nr:ArdC family protein [Paracoccus solventivorans]SHM56923.1 protein of unknown function [Paracoccus solventivorans]